MSINKAAAVPKSSISSWWQPGNKALPKQSPFLNTTQGGAACDGGTKNCTTYEYTMGTGGPCALWASCDSDPTKAGSSYWCGEYCGGGGAGEDSHMSKTGWLGLPLGVTFNRTSEVFARMQNWKSAKGCVQYEGSSLHNSIFPHYWSSLWFAGWGQIYLLMHC